MIRQFILRLLFPGSAFLIISVRGDRVTVTGLPKQKGFLHPVDKFLVRAMTALSAGQEVVGLKIGDQNHDPNEYFNQNRS